MPSGLGAERAPLIIRVSSTSSPATTTTDPKENDTKTSKEQQQHQHASGVPLDAWASDPCPSCLSWCGLLCPPTNAVKYMVHDFKTKVSRVKARSKRVSRKHIILFALFYLMLNVMHNATFLSQNFWLWSFKSGDSSAYVTMVMPAVVWAILDLTLIIPYKLFLRPTPSTKATWKYIFGCCGGSVENQTTSGGIDAQKGASYPHSRRVVAINDVEDDCESLAGRKLTSEVGSLSTSSHHQQQYQEAVGVPEDEDSNVGRERGSSVFRGHHIDRESLGPHVDTPLPRELEVIDSDHPSRKNFSIFTFWIKDREGILLQFLVGTLDASAGLLSAYSATHIPVILQLMLYSTSTIFIYCFHRLFYKETALKMSWLLALAFLFLIFGVVCAMVPQIQSGHAWNTYLNIPWLIIFIISVWCPCLYTVLQGRFLNKYRDVVHPEAAKIAALTGDFVVQLFVTIMFFPLDFLPWFGMQSDATASWDGFVAGVQCLLDCERTGMYFMLYTLGFFGGRILGLFLTLYSPTMQGFINQLCAPVTSLLLIVFPVLNVYGASHSVGWSLASFGCLLVSPVLYLLENEATKEEKSEMVASQREKWLEKHYIAESDHQQQISTQPVVVGNEETEHKTL